MAADHGCSFVVSDTAIGATSSMNWHLKNGYKKDRLLSWSDRDYYSCLFRFQLKPHRFWSNDAFCELYFLCSFVKCRLCYQENGKYRFLFGQYVELLSKF